MKIPKGQERCGIKMVCLKCNRQIKDTCKLTEKNLSSCKFKDRHRFNLIVHVPGTKNGKKMKLLETRDFDEAVIEMAKFKVELKNNDYHKVQITEQTAPKTNLFDLTVEYLNAMSGNSELEIHNLKRSKGHIANTRIALNRFSDCMVKLGYNLQKLDVKDIGDKLANDYLLYLKKYTSSEDLHNKDFNAMKTFFKWINEVKEYKISNPFRKAKIRVTSKKVAQMIYPHEFMELLKVVTPENGFWEFKNSTNHEKGKQLYRDYLKIAFRVALETGCRGEELVLLNWNQLREVSPGIEIFDITNLKVTRIQGSKGNIKEYNRPIPVTRSFKMLLDELGYDKKKGTNAYLIPRPKDISDMALLKNISRAFNHYIKLVDTGGRKIEFKDLRKTYFTRITMALGNKSKLFTGHADDKVLEDHYLAKEFAAGSLTDFSVFGSNDPKMTA
jgi:integrase